MSEAPWPDLSVVIALTYLSRNRVQAELAETYGISQSTVSRAISAITPLLGKVLKDHVPTVDDLDPLEQYIVDGTLLPCWSWAGHLGMCSGKHKTAGANVQVVCTLSGDLAWISDALPGSRRDSWCLTESGALERFPAFS